MVTICDFHIDFQFWTKKWLPRDLRMSQTPRYHKIRPSKLLDGWIFSFFVSNDSSWVWSTAGICWFEISSRLDILSPLNDPRIFILNSFIPNESFTLPMVTESLFMKVYSTVNEYCPLSNEVVEMDINWYQQWKRIRSHETKQWRLFIGMDSHFMKSNNENNETSRWKQWNNFIDNGNHIWNSRVKTVIDHDAKSHRLDPA